MQADLDALGEPADAERTSRLAAKCAEESPALAAKGAEMLAALKAKAAQGGEGGAAGSEKYVGTPGALSRAALARTNPSTASKAHAVLIDMVALGHAPSPWTSLLAACCRTGQRRQALGTFQALCGGGGGGDAARRCCAPSSSVRQGDESGVSWQDVPADDVGP